MCAGIVGICLGFFLSKMLRTKFPKADPIICGVGLLLSAPLLLAATFVTTRSEIFCFILLLLGEVTLNLNWAICGDILLVRITKKNLNEKRKIKNLFSLFFCCALVVVFLKVFFCFFGTLSPVIVASVIFSKFL